jgi:hypothetical protein
LRDTATVFVPRTSPGCCAAARAAVERLLAQVVSGELDVDKMDYLLRDSLFCGVRYGSYDLPRLLDTVVPIRDPDPERDGEWGIGVEEGGVHALEALVMARYYMFTQVYFNVTGKALELHLSAWLAEEGTPWPADPRPFSPRTTWRCWRACARRTSPHAHAVLPAPASRSPTRRASTSATSQRERFAALVPALVERFGSRSLLVSQRRQGPPPARQARVFVPALRDGTSRALRAGEPVSCAHLTRIESFRVYAAPESCAEVAAAIAGLLGRVDGPHRQANVAHSALGWGERVAEDPIASRSTSTGARWRRCSLPGTVDARGLVLAHLLPLGDPAGQPAEARTSP